jgi:hypothetical protein
VVTYVGGDAVSFWEELPIPDANLSIYQEVYAVEQWLRRIAYAALMARYSANWRGTLEPELASSLKRRLRQLDGRVYLDCENSDNAIWLLTLDELQELLLADSNWPAVKELTRLSHRVVESKLSEIREIRNVIGHSRAVGGQAELLTRAAASALRTGIDTFKNQLLYDRESEIHLGSPDDYSENSVPARFAQRTVNNDWSVFQPMLSESKYFYALTRLPCGPYDHFLGIRQFLAHFAPIRHHVLAILVNKMGVEFTLVWSKKSPPATHEQVMDFFFSNHDAAWISVPYDRQSTAAVCDPAIWFYENQTPERP